MLRWRGFGFAKSRTGVNLRVVCGNWEIRSKLRLSRDGEKAHGLEIACCLRNGRSDKGLEVLAE